MNRTHNTYLVFKVFEKAAERNYEAVFNDVGVMSLSKIINDLESDSMTALQFGALMKWLARLSTIVTKMSQ